MKVLVTGGAGYIGSTTAKALEESGHTPVVLDSLLAGPRAFVGDRIFYHGDIADRDLVRRIFDDHPDIAATIHMAARIVVPESVAEAAHGQIPAFNVTGTDLPTRDGTGLRDYVHVWDLARAHVAAIEQFDRALDGVGEPSAIINVGRGEGITVRELITAFETVYGRSVLIHETGPRPGDAIGAFAQVARARDLLGWEADLSVAEGIASALAWADKRQAVLGYA